MKNNEKVFIIQDGSHRSGDVAVRTMAGQSLCPAHLHSIQSHVECGGQVDEDGDGAFFGLVGHGLDEF